MCITSPWKRSDNITFQFSAIVSGETALVACLCTSSWDLSEERSALRGKNLLHLGWTLIDNGDRNIFSRIIYSVCCPCSPHPPWWSGTAHVKIYKKARVSIKHFEKPVHLNIVQNLQNELNWEPLVHIWCMLVGKAHFSLHGCDITT